MIDAADRDAVTRTDDSTAPITLAQAELPGGYPRNPNANGTDGVPQWRARPFTDPRYIAPGARDSHKTYSQPYFAPPVDETLRQWPPMGQRPAGPFAPPASPFQAPGADIRPPGQQLGDGRQVPPASGPRMPGPDVQIGPGPRTGSPFAPPASPFRPPAGGLPQPGQAPTEAPAPPAVPGLPSPFRPGVPQPEAPPPPGSGPFHTPVNPDRQVAGRPGPGAAPVFPGGDQPLPAPGGGRAHPGVAPAFPGTQPVAGADRPESPAPWAPQDGTAGGGVVRQSPDWITQLTLQPDTGLRPPTSGQGGVWFGRNFVPFGPDGQPVDIYANARRITEDSLNLRTNRWWVLREGLITGAATNAGWYLGDLWARTHPEPNVPVLRALHRNLMEMGPTAQSFQRLETANAEAARALTLAQDAQRVSDLATTRLHNTITRGAEALRSDPLRAGAADRLLRLMETPAAEMEAAVAASTIIDPAHLPQARAFATAAQEATAARTALQQALQTTAGAAGRPSDVGQLLRSFGPGVTGIADVTDDMIRGATMLNDAERSLLTAWRAGEAAQQRALAAFRAAAGTGTPAEAWLVHHAASLTDDMVGQAGALTQAEAQTLREYAQQVARRGAVATEHTRAGVAAADASQQLRVAREALAQQGVGATVSGTARSLVRGGANFLGVAGIAVGTDAIGNYLTGRPQDWNGSTPYGVEGLALPLALCPRMSMPARFGALTGVYAGSYVVSHQLSRVLGEPEGRFKVLGRPTGLEVVLGTAAYMAPIRSPYARAGLAVGGWALAKGFHIAFPEREPVDERNEARRALEQAVSTQGQQDFLNAVEQAREIGAINEAALELMRWDWFRQQSGALKDHRMIAWRGDAILATGVALGRLDQGSRLLDPTQHDQRNRFFPGSNADLGGEALMNLRAAAGTLIMMEQYARENRDEVVQERRLGDMIDEIVATRRFVEERIADIYNHDDARGIVDHLRYRFREGGDGARLAQFERTLGQRIATAPQHDPAYKAKLCRDMAMLLLAAAENNAAAGNGEHAAIHYRRIDEIMAEAERLAPDTAQHPRNQRIRQIQAELATRIGPAVQQQWQSPVANPFGIPGPGGARP